MHSVVAILALRVPVLRSVTVAGVYPRVSITPHTRGCADNLQAKTVGAAQATTIVEVVATHLPEGAVSPRQPLLHLRHHLLRLQMVKFPAMVVVVLQTMSPPKA